MNNNIKCKKDYIERHIKIFEENDNIELLQFIPSAQEWINKYEFCLEYIEQLKQKHCNWAVEIDSKTNNI